MVSSIDWTRTDQDFERAFTLPGRVYRDAEIFALEQQRIFGSEWLCAGHVSRLDRPGDYFVIDAGGESVIVTAGENGDARAFLNVCRHRGTRLLDQTQGNCRLIKCPYHSWSYSLDGKLKAAPGMDQTPGFGNEDYPLLNVRLEVWNGFLFINLDSEAAPIDEVLDDFPDLSYLDLGKLRRVGYHDYRVATNWKLVCENYNECYHCAQAHPQVHRVSTYRDFPEYVHVGRNFTGGPMALRMGFNTLTMSGVTNRAPLPGVPESEMDTVFYFNLYPNLLLSIVPDYVLAHYLWPIGPDTVDIETEWFCAPEQIEAPGFDAQDAISFWDTTNRQDWALCENALRGLRSRQHQPGRYHASEHCVHDFDRWYARTMSDQI